MKIVSLVKFVPDAQFDRHFTDEKTVDRSESILSELDEYAIEEALKTAGEDDETIALTMGPAKAANAVKKALQMGIDHGVHISDEALAGADAYLTAHVLAAALEKIGDVDLVITGIAATDAETSLVPSMLSEILDYSQLSFMADLEIDGTNITGIRQLEHSVQKVEAQLPAVVSASDQLNTPRYPNFKGILAAKKKEIQEFSLADLDLKIPVQSLTHVDTIEAQEERGQGTIVTDKGQAAVELVDFLETKKLI